MSSLGACIAKPPLQNYKNNIANTITMGEKREENQKRQKEKTAVGRNSGKQDEQCNLRKFAGCKISQLAKFRNLRNFASCKNFAILQNFCYAPFSSVFCSSFLLVSDLQC